jgi:hypothetical protein
MRKRGSSTKALEAPCLMSLLLQRAHVRDQETDGVTRHVHKLSAVSTPSEPHQHPCAQACGELRDAVRQEARPDDAAPALQGGGGKRREGQRRMRAHSR